MPDDSAVAHALFAGLEEFFGHPAGPRNSLTAEDTLLFLHIEKTAGTSVREWLTRHFSTEEIFTTYNSERLGRVSERDVAGKRLIAGHFWGNHCHRLRRPYRLITWLRNPVERSLSEYFALKNLSQLHAVQGPAVDLAQSLELRACLSHDYYRWLRSDVQTRSLSYGFSSPDWEALPPAIALQTAARTLLCADGFGLLERMQESTDMLTWRYGWRPMQFDIHQNANRYRRQGRDLTEDDLASAEQLNRLDSQLYTLAVKVFDDRVQEYLRDVARFTSECQMQPCSAFAEEGWIHRPYAEIRPLIAPILERRYQLQAMSIPRRTELRYTFDQPLSGEGWHDREGSHTLTQQMFRWTSRTRAELDLPLCRQRELRLCMRVLFSQEKDFPVEIVVDGQSLPLSIRRSNDFTDLRSLLVEATIPPCGYWRTRLTTLALVMPDTFNPTRLNVDSHDDRNLGCAIDWLHLRRPDIAVGDQDFQVARAA